MISVIAEFDHVSEDGIRQIADALYAKARVDLALAPALAESPR